MKLGTDTNSLINHVYGSAAPVNPSVGLGATLLHWTDRTACTVIAFDGKTLTVQEDTATRTDSLGMSDCQSYAYAPNPGGAVHSFRINSKGKWTGGHINPLTRRWSFHGGTVALGVRNQHHDYSF